MNFGELEDVIDDSYSNCNRDGYINHTRFQGILSVAYKLMEEIKVRRIDEIKNEHKELSASEAEDVWKHSQFID